MIVILKKMLQIVFLIFILVLILFIAYVYFTEQGLVNPKILLTPNITHSRAMF